MNQITGLVGIAYLLTGTAENGSLDLLHGAGDLVAQSGLALLVVDYLLAAEEGAAGTGCPGCGCCCCVTVGHFEVWCVCRL
jgi:hypothetical protein